MMKIKIIFVCTFLLFISGCATTTPLMKASENGDTYTTEKLIKEGAKINGQDSNGYTPLMYAAWSGKTEVVKLLINKGADVNKRDNKSYTPLLWATYCKHLDIAKLLIDNGADINAQDATGSTALHYTDSLMLTQYLLDRNADTTLKNEQGWTALRKSIYDKNIGKVALIRKKTNWQGEIYSLTSEEKIGRSVYEPEKDMFDVPSDEERVYKLATHDCNTMIFSNVSAGMVLLELNYFGLPSLARAASRAAQREGLFKQCMTVMGFECKNNCSKDSKPVEPKEDIVTPKVEESVTPKKKAESTIGASPSYNSIKGIVLTNGNIVEGQILNISTNAVIIRTKDGKVLSYSFEKEVRRFIKD